MLVWLVVFISSGSFGDRKRPSARSLNQQDENLSVLESTSRTETEETSLVDKYYDKFKESTTREQKYQLIINALTDLATILDQVATSGEINYEIGGHLHSVLSSVDIRDREMKKKFNELKSDVDQLKNDIDNLVEQTRNELKENMKKIRKEIVENLGTIISNSLNEQRSSADEIQSKIEKSVGEYKKTSIVQAVGYFIGFQILLAICIYFYRKYAALLRI